ncbi:MAG: hypothetical protein IVW57_14210 [Ktedonobacterales bacterium]|nr:hypothetical protein [Ktedonobacterales bacterium]
MQKPTTATTSAATSTDTTSTPAGYTPEQEITRRHVWSVQCIPWGVLPPVNPARIALERLAAAGLPAYALGAEDGYLICVRGHWHSPAQWMAHYAAFAGAYAAMIASAESAAS